MKEIEETIIDLTYLNEITNNNQEDINKILDLFKKQTVSCIEGLLKSLQDKDYEQIRFFAHSAKNDLNVVGRTFLSKKMQELEILSKNRGDFQEISGLISLYIKESEILFEEINKIT